jgi:peptide/nickel transport system permease protein
MVVVSAKPRPRLRSRLRHRNLPLIGGTVIVGAIILLALAAPLITSYKPTRINLLDPFAPISSHHLLGTDELGRDVFTRILYAARLDLRLAIVSVVVALSIGAALGCAAGYYGRWVDVAISRLGDVIAAVPLVVLLLVLVLVLGGGESSFYVALGSVGWVVYMRIVRAEVLVAREHDYIGAARAGGVSTRRVIFRHLLPNVLSQAVTFAMLDVVNVLSLVVFVGYLGFGIEPPTPEWGGMISEGQTLLQTHWQLSTFPGLAVVITGFGFALLGDGLRDAWRSR